MSPQELNTSDNNFNKTFRLKLVVAETGAIEKFSDVYLYRVEQRKEP
jgi:hypothetical protein